MRLATVEYFANEFQSVVIEPREPQTSFPLHDHEFDEIVIVQSGNGWHIINDRPSFITRGEVFYINAADHHEFERVDGLHLVNVLYRLDRLTIQSEDIRRSLFSVDRRPAGDELEGRHWQITEETLGELTPVIAALVRESRKADPLSKVMSEALFLQLVVALHRNRFPLDGGALPPAARLNHVLGYLRHNFAEPIDLDDLAERFGYSVRNFHRIFREATGTTPHNYLIKVRINHAMRALSSTDDSITDIAFDSGFNDGNYFSYCFNKMAGVSPRAYRRLLRRGPVDRIASEAMVA
ncbi:MAG: helix-turn-helix domain-containing protein [Azospirillaceae bacterium]|nr:helix-turn-helix domain-containing protein [Azospirillaceae bacterium]